MEGKKTIITVIIMGLYNLLRMFKPDIPVLLDTDVAIAINVIGTILAIIFRLIAKPKTVIPPKP